MIDHLAQVIRASLRLMDAEATTVRADRPTGLSWYAAHARRESRRPRTEPEWSKRLAVLLSERGWLSVAECRYPAPAPHSGSRRKCDVVVTLPPSDAGGGGRLWLEVKGAWKQWWLDRGPGGEWFYRSHLLHPLVPGLDKSKTHTAALDLRKLKAITREHGTHIGLAAHRL